MPVTNDESKNPAYTPTAGRPITFQWGAAVAERVVQRFTDAAERSAEWPNPEDGSVCTVGGQFFIYRGGMWCEGLVPVGTIIDTVQATAIPGFLICDGSDIPSDAHFAELRKRVGAKTPNFTGAVAMGADGGSVKAGQRGGSNVISAAQMPQHSHVMQHQHDMSHGHGHDYGAGDAVWVRNVAGSWSIGRALVPGVGYVNLWDQSGNDGFKLSAQQFTITNHNGATNWATRDRTEPEGGNQAFVPLHVGVVKQIRWA